MSDIDKLKNILSFLCILFGESEFMNAIMNMSPEYILEKYERYVKSDRREWPWGMHPSFKNDVFVKYLVKHKMEFSDDNAENW